MRRLAMQPKSHGHILPELNDAQTSLCLFVAILIVHPHIFNWSVTSWLAVISPVVFPALLQFFMWGTKPWPSIRRRSRAERMQEALAILRESVEESPQGGAESDSHSEEIEASELRLLTFAHALHNHSEMKA